MVVYISETKLDGFCHSGFSDNCLHCYGYFHNVSAVCRTREPSRNFELRPLLNPPGSPVLILLAITGYKCKVFPYCYRLLSELNQQLPDDCLHRSLGNQRLLPLRYVSCWRIQSEFLVLLNLMFLLD